MQQTTLRMRAYRQKTSTHTTTWIVLALACIAIVFGMSLMHAASATTSSKSVPMQADPRLASLAAWTTMASEVPTALPANGVTINDEFVLRPLPDVWTSSSAPGANVRITASEAITIGRTYANAEPFAATTLLAGVTDIDSVLPPGVAGPAHVVQNIPAWIVTFTTDHPQNVIQGSAHKTGFFAPRHFTIAIDASTGAFVVGFFTA